MRSISETGPAAPRSYDCREGPLRTEGALSLTRQTASPRTISGLGADTETADRRPDQYHPDGALQKAVLPEIIMFPGCSYFAGMVA
jgi:hypothetical protein